MAVSSGSGDGEVKDTNGLPDGLLESFVPHRRLDALAEGRDLPDRAAGSAVFADISGFTPLAEALVAEHGRQRGAEELDANLNRVYEAIIDDLSRYRGEVLYFSGDAITCWLDGDDGSRAVRCALDMQATMRTLGTIPTIHGPLTLSIKVAVAVGTVRRFVVGDPDILLIDMIGGRLVDHLAAAESLAEKGEVVADASVLAALGDASTVDEIRIDPDVGRECGVVSGLDRAVDRDPFGPMARLDIETVRPWLLDDVFTRLAVGGDEFLGELRTAYPIFVKFGGFDFDDDPDVASGVDAFVRAVQHVLERYAGTLLGITVGDKGAYINAVVGAPRRHEDDALRAVSAALEIRDLEHSTAARGIQVGVAHGPIYAGSYGHSHRRTYTVLGDPTNVAARLMSAAPPGEVYVTDEVATQVEHRFEWQAVGPLSLKGKAVPVEVRSPVSARRRAVRHVPLYELPMVGRDRELSQVRSLLEAALRGDRRVVSIIADAGMGKSRFVAELIRGIEFGGIPIAYGQADSLGRSVSYTVWLDVWRRLFGIEDDQPDDEQAAQVVHRIELVDPHLADRAPLVGTVLGIEFPDNELTSTFDAKLRKTSLESLLGDLLVARVSSGPLVIVLEDLQWIDPTSNDLLVELVRRTEGLPVLFVLSFRGEPAFVVPPEVHRLSSLTEIVLGELDDDGIRAVTAAKIGQVFGAGAAASDALMSVVLGRAQGNPFYAEELVNYLHRLDLDPSDPASATIELPATLNAIVLERIDTLDERPRQAVKVASIVGRQFSAPMLSVHRPLGTDAVVIGHLDVARSVDLILPEDEELIDWLFRHAITREVAYESIPFEIRRELHERIGDRLAADEGAVAVAGRIAHHYWHSDAVEKQRHWLRVAGDAARASYANEAAVEHYTRLSEVAEPADRPAVLLDLAGVHELVGDWETSAARASEARELADAGDDPATVARCDVALAEIERKHGRFDAATDLLRRARDGFTSVGDESGLARVAHLRGTLAAQKGDLVEARRHYEASREVRELIDDRAGLASILSNLGVVAEYEGDFDESRRHHERALELRRAIDDRWAIAVSYTNLGMIAVHEERFDDARELFEDSMRLNAEVGDTWMVAIAHNNLGNANRGLGRYAEALDHYAAALATIRTYRDYWALAFLFEDIALLALGRAADTGDTAAGAAHEIAVARGLIAAADRWRAEIAAPRPVTVERELAARLAVLDDRRPSATDWDDDDAAFAAAAEFCAGPGRAR